MSESTNCSLRKLSVGIGIEITTEIRAKDGNGEMLSGCKTQRAELGSGLCFLGVKEISEIKEAVRMVVAASPVGFHCIQPNLRQPPEFAG